MPFLLKPQVLIALLAIGAIAQESPVKLCTSEACDKCPNSLITTGTGFPSCVIYDRDTALGGKFYSDMYEPEIGGSRNIYFDIAATQGDCQTIIRTPASTTDVNCGVPIYGGPGDVCFKGATKSTFMVQFCCGVDDCTGAGVKRDGAILGGSLSSAVFYNADGDVIVPQSVGDATGDKFDAFLDAHGLNSSSAIQTLSDSGTPIFKIGYDKVTEKRTTKRKDMPLKKRGCDKFVMDGAPYTKTSTESMQVSGFICDSNSKVSITNENSVSRTSSFGASVGDPYGIVSASVSFSTEETASQSYTYEFTPDKSQCGHVSFTPFYRCVGGKITGCEGGDQNGEVCTAKRISKHQVDGAYLFVQD